MTQFATVEGKPHLGGYIPGGDPATFCPGVWEHMLTEGARTALDVGCGEGHAVSYLRERGCEAHGIDGVPQEGDWFIEHDYSSGPFPPRQAGTFYESVDLVWSCEFVEHVKEPWAPNFLHTFKLGRTVLMTHAEPGQPGYHHVNCRPADYWVGALAAVGFRFDPDLTRRLRPLDPGTHFERSGLAFRRVTATA